MRRIGCLLFGLALASLPLQAAADENAGRACRHALRVIDRTVAEAGMRDAEARRVPGFPYLRTNRFLASFAPEILDDEVFEVWMLQMAALDREGRRFELQNLGPDGRAALDADLERRLAPGWTTRHVLDHCPGLLHELDFVDLAASARLVDASAVPDDYVLAAQTIGFYPLTAIPVARGWERWQTTHLPDFEVPFGDEARLGEPTVYRPVTITTPPTEAEAGVMVGGAEDDPLRVAKLDHATLVRLAETFAPVFLVDVASDADRPGHPVFGEDGLPTVDPERPVAFVRLSHARLQGTPVLQLSYTIWFAERPRTGAVDLLGGRLDGLIWRVTFDRDGRPFVYDTIHPCGCYHLFFPAAGTERQEVAQDQVGDLREAPTVPRSAPERAPGEQMAIRVQASSHYLSGLAGASDLDRSLPEVGYRLVIPEVADAPLRAMPLPGGGSRSLYGPDGLVPGSERLERLVLWPMGISSPGAMRQWGHHATAFVGRRHFDDPRLFDQAFSR